MSNTISNYVEKAKALFGFQSGYNTSLADTALYDRTNDYMQRASLYQYNWSVYRGYTAEAQLNEDGSRPIKVNFVRHNIDKVNYFAFGKGFAITHEKYQDEIDLAMKAFGPRFKEKLLRMGQFGSVTGNAYLLAAPVEQESPDTLFDADTKSFKVSLKAEVRVVVLNSSYVTPIYSDFDMDELVAVHIRIPQKHIISGKSHSSFHHCVITKEEIAQWTSNSKGEETAESREVIPNPIKKVYCTHIRNLTNGDSVFGIDDLSEVEKINSEVQASITNTGSILKYHGDPITLVFGAKSGNLKKGPNKIWGNLPKDGDVRNLELAGDLGAATNHLKELKTDLNVLMGVPQIAQGVEQAISNTSGVALHTMYMPLIEKSDIKHALYGPGLLNCIVNILRWTQKLALPINTSGDGRKKKLLTDAQLRDIEESSTIIWKSPLPKDKLVEVQIQIAKLQGNLQTTEDALRELGEPNPAKKAAAIKAEKEEQAQAAFQNQARMASLTQSENPTEKKEDAKPGPSGMEASNGVNKKESEQQKGRPNE